MPIKVPFQITTTTYQSVTFLQNTKDNSLKTTAIFSAIADEVNKLCNNDANEPIINQYFQALQLLTLNVQAILQSQNSHSSARNHSISFPAPLPILISQPTKVADIDQLYYNIFTMRLTPAEMSYIYLLIENEKITTALWLKNVLPANTIYPTLLQINQYTEKPSNQQQPRRIFNNHPELLPKTQANNQSRIAVKNQYQPGYTENTVNNIQNDQPDPAQQPPTTPSPNQQLHPWDEALLQRNAINHPQPATTSSTPSPPTSSPTTLTPSILQALNRPTMSPTIQILARKKRHWLSQAFSDLTGLATQTDLNILNANEDKMRAEEERTQQELQRVETKTQSIIQIIDEQAIKLSKLYADESEVKQAIKKVLRDETDLIMQLSQLTTTIEIQSDIAIEYSAFSNTLMLIPHMLEEIQESILAITTQSIYPSLLPIDNIKKYIPMYTRASILSATISAVTQASQPTVEMSLPEFQDPYTAYYLHTIPIAHETTNNMYTVLNLENRYVAVDATGQTFLYKPGTCTSKSTINICMPQMIQIHKNNAATSCCESILAPSELGAKHCLDSMQTLQIFKQSYIYIKEQTIIRLFSPFEDKISTLCNNVYKANAGNLTIGYTDLSFKHDCTLYTSQLVIHSPYTTITDETIKPLLSTPDLSMEIEALIKDIQLTHNINVTTLGSDLKQLNVDVNNELYDLQKVTEILRKASEIEELKIFDPTSIKLEKLSTSNEAMKLLTWSVAILALMFLICLIYSCCPLAIGTILKVIWKTIKLTFTCACLCAKKSRIIKTYFGNQHASPSTDLDISSYSDQQPSATIKYIPDQEGFRRRLFTDDSNEEILIYGRDSRKKTTTDQVNIQLSERHDDSFPSTIYKPSAPYTNIPKNFQQLNPQNLSDSLATLQCTQPLPTQTSTKDHDWQIKKTDKGLILTSTINGSRFFYNLRTGQVLNANGEKETRILHPATSLVNEYNRTMQTIPPITLPDLKLLKNNSTIEFDSKLLEYYTPVINSAKRYYHFGYNHH